MLEKGEELEDAVIQLVPSCHQNQDSFWMELMDSM
jgi:hypothetical protein